MEKKDETHKTFGLIGKNIDYSFSRNYFSEKFNRLKLSNHQYVNFDLADLCDLKPVLDTNICGLNVTIPYKEAIIPHLDSISKKAKEIGAVNTIKISNTGSLKGYNTDAYGFRKSIEPFLRKHHTKALILGTGGAAKAVAYALKKMEITYQFVSRNKSILHYANLSEEHITTHPLIINCTPLGTHPNTTSCPNIPYHKLTEQHLLYDLIYNPEETLFLKKGKKYGARICNGQKMLIFQAEKAWRIWNENQ